MANPITGLLLRFARRLRFPTLFFVTAGLFLADLAIPDVIPLIDELLLGLGALLLASLRKRVTPTSEADSDTSDDATPAS